jgi:hypothetical protein
MRYLLLAAFLFTGSAYANDGTSLGLVLGNPNGISARHWLSEEHSIEGAAGWAVSRSRFQVNGNFLWNQPGAVSIGDQAFDLFYGAGVSLRTKSGSANNEVVFGPRVPIGLSHDFANPDIEVFAEAALNIGIIPSSDLYLDANLGVRFYF